jgi:FlaG/FlaF family flagellin (archaellin)
MVAITVILAAVIVAFVFGLAGTAGSTKNVGLTVAKSGEDAFVVTVQGGTDLGSLTQLSASANGTAYDEFGGPDYSYSRASFYC